MKKVLIFGFIFCLLIAATACGDAQQDPTQVVPATDEVSALPPGADIFYGLIVADMGDTLLVTENKTNGKTAGLYTLPEKYMDETQDKSKLVPGTYITLHYNGTVIETYPARFELTESFTCDETKEDLVTPILRFVLANVPDSAQWLALDLTGIADLSDGEREAVCYLAENKLADKCGIVRYDPQQFTAEELLTAENSPENGAVLAVDGQLENGKLTGTWRLTDTQQVTEGEWETAIVYYLN